jgi:hypothetical protein
MVAIGGAGNAQGKRSIWMQLSATSAKAKTKSIY